MYHTCLLTARLKSTDNVFDIKAAWIAASTSPKSARDFFLLGFLITWRAAVSVPSETASVNLEASSGDSK